MSFQSEKNQDTSCFDPSTMTTDNNNLTQWTHLFHHWLLTTWERFSSHLCCSWLCHFNTLLRTIGYFFKYNFPLFFNNNFFVYIYFLPTRYISLKCDYDIRDQTYTLISSIYRINQERIIIATANLLSSSLNWNFNLFSPAIQFSWHILEKLDTIEKHHNILIYSIHIEERK